MSIAKEPAEASVGKRVAKATGAIAFFHVGWKLLGLVEKPLMARYFGTGSAADAFTAASRVVLQVFAFVDQFLTHCFMPTFIRIREAAGEKEAWRLASTVLNLILMAAAILGVLIFFFAPQVIAVAINVRENAEAAGMAAPLLRIMAPVAIILPVSAATYVILNAYKIFGLPAAADAAFKSGTVIALLFLAKTMGAPALATGIVLGAVLKIGMHLFGLRGKLRFYRPIAEPTNPAVKTVGVLAMPLLLGNTLALLRPLIDNRLASELGIVGAMTALVYARALVDAPSQIFPLALRKALFPFISEMAARDERVRMTEITVRAIRVIAVLLVPMTAGILLLRYPIVQTVYEWGRFGEHSTELVVPALTFLALGLLAFGAEMILLEPYFAMRDTVTPTKIGIWTFFVHVGFAWASTQVFGMGIGGIALAYTVARIVKVLILAYGLRRRLAPVAPGPLVAFTARLGLAVAGMTLVAWLLVVHPVLPVSFSLLQTSHLKEDARLVVTLRRAEDPLSRYVVAQLSPETQAMLAGHPETQPPARELRRALVDDLNRLIQGECIYTPDRFAQVLLTRETRRLAEGDPRGGMLARVNRLLLREAYPDEVARPGKLGDLIRLAVPSAVGAGVFVLLCLLLKLEEATFVLKLLLRRLRPRAA